MAKLRKKRKLTKKDLKQDEVLSGMARFLNWISENKQTAFLYLGAIVLILLLIFVLKNASVSARYKRANDLTVGSYYFNQGYYDIALKQFHQVYRKNKRRLEGGFALYYAAACAYRLERYDEAQQYYQEFLERFGQKMKDVAFICKLNLAHIDANNGKIDAALNRLKSLEPDAPEFIKPEVLYNEALLYTELKQFDNARTIIDTLKKDYKDTPYSTYASDLLKQINDELPFVK